MPQLDRVLFNYQLVVVLLLFASLFLIISWLALSISFARMTTRDQMDLTATDTFKALEHEGILLLAFNELLVHNRDFFAKKNIDQKVETNYFKKSLYFFIITSLVHGNCRYALIMDKTLFCMLRDSQF